MSSLGHLCLTPSLCLPCAPPRQFHAALEDLSEAARLCPNNREIQRLLQRVEEECRQVEEELELPPDDAPPPSHEPRPCPSELEAGQELYEEEEADYMERDMEAPPPSDPLPRSSPSPSVLPLSHSLTPSPGHRDPPYLSGGQASLGQAFEFRPGCIGSGFSWGSWLLGVGGDCGGGEGERSRADKGGGPVAMAAGTAGAQSAGTWSSGHGRGQTEGERGQ